MSSFSPPLYNSDIFNSGLFITNTEALTIDVADARYIRIGGFGYLAGLNVAGNIDAASITISGAPLNLNAITGVTPGIAAANKALIVDSNIDITNIRNLTSTNNLIVNRSTNGECIISTNGTVRNAIHCLTNSSHIGTTTNHNFNLQANNTNVLQCLSTGDVNIINALTTGSSITVTNGTTPLSLSNTTSSSTFRTTIQSSGGHIDIGSFTNHDFSLNTNNTRRLTVSTGGNVNITNHDGVSTGLQLGGTLVTATASELNYVDVVPGTIAASKAIVVDASSNVNSTIRCFKSASGQQLRFEAGTSTGVIFHTLNGSLFMGTISANDLIIQTQNVGRVTITSNGNVNIANSVSGLQLDLGNTGTGANLPNLTFRGTTFNDTLYTGITQGGALASKAVVLNSTLDYSGIRDLSITRNFIASTSIASPTITCDSITANVGVTTNSLTVNGDANVTGNYISNGTVIIQNTRNLVNINSIDFYAPSLLYKSTLRGTSIALGDGVEIYNTEFNTNSVPNLNFRNDNNSSPIFMEMCGYLNNNRTTMTANGMPFQIRYIDGQGFNSGLNISCMNTTQASNTNYNVCLSARSGTIPHVVVNDQYNQCHIHPQNLLELNTSYAQNIILGKKTRIRDQLWIDAANAAIYVKSTGGAGSRTSLDFEDDTGLVYEYGIRGSTETPRGWYWYVTSHRMCLLNNGRLGLGTTSPSCGFDCATGENSVTTTTNIAINTLSYNVSNNTWSNLGGGPVSVNMCARFRGSVWIQDKIYATSDRRLKKDIIPLDFNLEHYSKLNPVSYKWKNTEKTMLGLIAQECKDICGEAITAVENDNMKKELEDDVEGYQLTVDYNCINMMNVVAIKKLISEVENLKKQIELLNNYGPIKKFLQKNNNDEIIL